MMSSLATGTMPGMPGVGGIAGPRRQPARSQKKKSGQRFGQPGQAQRGPATGCPVDPAAAFGGEEFDQAALEKAMADFQLLPELRGRFGQ